jgi:hypothetical protein
VLLGARARLQAALAVAVEDVLHHGAGLEHHEVAVGHGRHLAHRIELSVSGLERYSGEKSIGTTV